MTYAMYATARYVVVLCFFYLFLKVPEIGRFSVVMGKSLVTEHPHGV